jgi:hypothetical protein
MCPIRIFFICQEILAGRKMRNEMPNRKRGRPAFKPTATQRRRIMHGVSVGLTLDQLALDLEMAGSTMRRVFAKEIKTARVRLVLDNLDRLHRAADKGNVSAMRELARMMMEPVQPAAEAEDDQWADVVGDRAFLSRNPEIH